MGTYIVGDIHGCYDEWMELKNFIEEMDTDARFILVGDIIDRGPKVIEMITWALDNIKPNSKYQMVLGNHEHMIINWANQYIGTNTSKNSQVYLKFEDTNYDFKYQMSRINVTDEFVKKIIEFFKSLPLYIEHNIHISNNVQKYIISHAAFPCEAVNKKGDVELDLYKESKEIIEKSIVWKRNYFGNSWEANTIVVHGHTPTCIYDLKVRGSIPGKIDFRKKDINVDCGEVFNGELYRNFAAIRLEDLTEIYLRELNYEILGWYNSQPKYKMEMLKSLGIDAPNKNIIVNN